MSITTEQSQARIAELEQRLSSLAQSKSRLELINRLLTSLSSVAGLDSMVQHILSILMQTIGAENVAIIYHLENGWQYRDIYGASRGYAAADNPLVRAALSTGQAQRVSVVSPEAQDPDAVGEPYLENWVYPLLSHERKIGAVCMEGMQLTDGFIFNELLPFFIYAGLMLDNEISNYARLAEAHRRLQDSETLYRSLFEQSPDGIVLWTAPELKAFQFNQAAHQQLGYTREEFMPLGVADIHVSAEPFTIDDYMDVLRRNGVVNFEAFHRTKAGERRVIFVSLKMLEIDGQPMVLAIHRDVTERRQAEEHMALMNFALDNIHEAVYLINENSHFTYVNKESCQALGYSREELMTKTVSEIDSEISANRWSAHWQELKGRGTLNFEAAHRHKNGQIFPVEITANYFEFNQTGYNLALVRDVSERRRAEEERLKLEKQILHAQKLESLGVLAGGIAHDFNNLLAAIMGHAELSRRRLGPESPALNNLKQIEQAAERAADLAKQMLAYSGKGKFVVERIDLNALLEEMLHMLEVSISKKVVLRLSPYPALPAAEADATQLRQIIMNLVINASEAIGDQSGYITITTGCMDCDRNYLKDVWLAENLTDGLYVYLEIADTGCGMDKKTLAKLFDPFFTTKFTGRGLGMSATLGIVRGHRGAIKVYSEPGKGTTFKILLPASGKPVEIFNNDSPEDSWQGSGRVLLVDDEETVRGIGSAMLLELGFMPLTANDGRQALEVFKANPDIILVILDLTMPHMDGEQCYRMLRQLKSDVKVIMSSGYNEHEVTQKFLGKGLAGFVQKPYKLSVLKEAIKKII